MDPILQTCRKCGDTCKTCQGSDKCATCPDGFGLGDTKCLKCASNEFIGGDTCLKCGANCLRCSSLAQCDSCDTNYEFKNGACVCKDGFFLDGVTKTCKACGSTCATCDRLGSCKTCRPGFGLGSTICVSCASN